MTRATNSGHGAKLNWLADTSSTVIPRILIQCSICTVFQLQLDQTPGIVRLYFQHFKHTFLLQIVALFIVGQALVCIERCV